MTEETTESKKSTITIKKDDLWKYSSFVLGALVVVLAIVIFVGGGNNGGTPNGLVVDNPTPTAPQPSQAVSVDLNKVEHITGDSNADIVLVEWTDFECPFCGRHYEQTYGQIKSQYVDTGKIRYATEHFPLSFHPQAQKAAESFECAAKVGGEDAAWEMHDLLFGSGVQGGVASFKQYAGQIGINQADFDSCLDSGETAQKVAADMQEGQLAGVRGTPGFAIVAADGTVTPISGAQPFSAFDAALKAAGA